MKRIVLAELCLMVFILCGVGEERVSKESVLGLWHFDEDVGVLAKDSSGNSNDLHLSGVVWAEGRKGPCLAFDGAKSCATAAPISAALVFPGDEFTISAWIKADYEYPKDMEIVNCGGARTGPGYRFSITYGALLFRSGEGGSNYWQIQSPKFKEGKIPEKVLEDGPWYSGQIDNRWYHVAVTYKDGVYKMYIDARLASQKKERPINPNPAKKVFTIGAYGGAYHFKGLIDEVEILNRAKTGEEIIGDCGL